MASRQIKSHRNHENLSPRGFENMPDLLRMAIVQKVSRVRAPRVSESGKEAVGPTTQRRIVKVGGGSYYNPLSIKQLGGVRVHLKFAEANHGGHISSKVRAVFPTLFCCDPRLESR